jgi:hypothetical protein
MERASSSHVQSNALEALRDPTPSTMEYRRLGRSNLRVSAVGFGSCQLRRVPEQQALDTLKRGFDLGVNLVHTAPDYEGADDLVAQAVQESGRNVLILTQGYGDLAHFEWLFESACRKFKKHRLEMFGIACIDDREYLGEPVWGPGGMVEFLQNKKKPGRLGATFCTTHGPPEYIARLVTSECFDAIMLSYYSLGSHLLSYHPDPSRPYEDIPRNRTEIFSLAARHDVGLMIMTPLAGGLLCEQELPTPCGVLDRALEADGERGAPRSPEAPRGVLRRAGHVLGREGRRERPRRRCTDRGLKERRADDRSDHRRPRHGAHALRADLSWSIPWPPHGLHSTSIGASRWRTTCGDSATGFGRASMRSAPSSVFRPR